MQTISIGSRATKRLRTKWHLIKCAEGGHWDPRWELALEQCMGRLKKTQADIIKEIKSADWKILIAAALKCKTSTTNVWIADKLNMGVPHAVSRYTGIFKQNGKDNETPFLELIAHITT
jgi:hypothetical protein